MSSLTPAERAARDSRIVAAVRDGEPREAVAARFGITTRQVRRIVSAQPSSGSVAVPPLDVPEGGPLSIDPLGELARAIATHRDAVDRLRGIAIRSGDGPVALGAWKAAAQTARDLLGVLRDAGVTPPSSFDWRGEGMWARAWAALEAVAREHGLDDESIHAAWVRNLDRPHAGVELTGLGPADDLDRVAA